jgi:hypothetical protein
LYESFGSPSIAAFLVVRYPQGEEDGERIQSVIENNTVFILGAGASAPYGYPTGEQLREYICLHFEDEFGRIKDNPSTSVVQEFCYTFKRSSTRSIDLFLSRNDRFSEIGKIAILLGIFDAERNSRFREDMSPERRNQDWYSYLFHRMTADLITPKDYIHFGKNNVTFITFNYDRSLEYFLHESLKNSFSQIADEEIIRVIKQLRIYHIYGKVAELPWESSNSGATCKYLTPDRDPYTNTYDALKSLAKNIRIVHESNQDDFPDVRRAIMSAERVFFLGFGYARENMEILGIGRILNDKQDIFGTGLGLLQKERNDVTASIRRSLKDTGKALSPSIHDMDCVTLLRTFL